MIYSSSKTYQAFMYITPEIASDMLTHNTNNRSISRKTIAVYAQMMRDGKWELTNQGIGFYADGTLADGQHRLLAIVESGKTVEMSVMYGINKDAVYAIDNHRARTTRDILALDGCTVNKTVIGAIRAAMTCNDKLPPYVISDFINEHGEWMDILKPFSSRSIAGITNRAVCGAVITILANGEPAETVRRFVDALLSDEPIDNTDGAKTVLRYAIKLRTSRYNSSGCANTATILCTTQRMYKAFAHNQYLSKIVFTDTPIYPYIENSRP